MVRTRQTSAASGSGLMGRSRLQCFSPGDLLQVVLVAAGVLSILNLFLSPLQNGGVGLGVGRVQEAGEAAGEGGPAGTQVEVREAC